MDNPDTLATLGTQDTGRRINNDLLITTRTPLKTEVNLGAPEGSAVHHPLMTPVLLMLKNIKII
jgi:hypothetical protein